MDDPRPRRTVHLGRAVFGPHPPRPTTVKPLRRVDFPHATAAHLDVASALSSPLLLGPPLCEELVAFVEHVFTEEEATVVRHLRGLGRTAAEVARAERRPFEEVKPLLRAVAKDKGAIWAAGGGRSRRYGLLPVVPGMFEMMMVRQRFDSLSDWHRRFLELFEALHATGYFRVYTRHNLPVVRFLPNSLVASRTNAALPSDKLEVVIDRFDSFAVADCQCRMAARSLGAGCSRPLDNCMAMGEWAESAIAGGHMRRVTKRDALRIKREAEASGCVSWILNNESARGQASCSCCGCCCYGMRTMREYDAPALFAPPHFLPEVDRSRCTWCGSCAKTCPMGALVVDPKRRQGWMIEQRCIGCGLCSIACDKAHAIEMRPVPDYRLPASSWLALAARAAPNAARTALEAYLERGTASTWWPR